jgi:hypothetical protein
VRHSLIGQLNGRILRGLWPVLNIILIELDDHFFSLDAVHLPGSLHIVLTIQRIAENALDCLLLLLDGLLLPFQ